MQNIMHIGDDDRNRTAAGHDGAAIYLGNTVYRGSLLHGLIVRKYSIISNRGTLLALLALWAIASVTATALVICTAVVIGGRGCETLERS